MSSVAVLAILYQAKMAGISIQEVAAHCKVEEAWLDREVPYTSFYEISRCLSQWKFLAPKMNISQAEVDDIEEDHRKAEEKRIGFLEKWKQKMSMKATYRALVESLLDIQRADDARRVLESKHAYCKF